jgi:hypothetical protein
MTGVAVPDGVPGGPAPFQLPFAPSLLLPLQVSQDAAVPYAAWLVAGAGRAAVLSATAACEAQTGSVRAAFAVGAVSQLTTSLVVETNAAVLASPTAASVAALGPAAGAVLALSYFVTDPDGLDSRIMTRLASVGPGSGTGAGPSTHDLTLGGAVAQVTGDRETHTLAALSPLSWAIGFPMDNATTTVDDDELQGYPLGVVVLSATLDSSGSSASVASAPLVLWGRGGSQATVQPGATANALVRPFQQPGVSMHFYLQSLPVSFSAAGAPAGLAARRAEEQAEQADAEARTGGAGAVAGRRLGAHSRNVRKQQRAAKASDAAAGAGTSGVAVKVLFAGTDFAAANAIRVASARVIHTLQTDAGSPGKTTVTAIDVVFGESAVVTPAGVSGGYRSFVLSGFHRQRQTQTDAVEGHGDSAYRHFAVVYSDVSRGGQVRASVFRLLQGAGGTVVTATGEPLTVSSRELPSIDPLGYSSYFWISVFPIDAGDSSLLVSAVASSPGVPSQGNVTLIVHKEKALGVLAQPVECEDTDADAFNIVTTGTIKTESGGFSAGYPVYATALGDLIASRSTNISSPFITNRALAYTLVAHLSEDSIVGIAVDDSSVLLMR